MARSDVESELDPYLMGILASRIGSISTQMQNIMVRSARSSVLALARDCSTAVLDGNGDVLASPRGFPVHVGAGSLLGQSLLELHGDDLREGDAYLNNSPYHGNSHPADYSILVPVFYDGELMFICLCKGHQADIGNSIPSTYHPKAKDVYEEGAIIWPCVRIQRDYHDIQDIIRIAKMRIRVPEVWYGDYLAQVGASRIGEQELKKLVGKYGKETIKKFCQQWHEYGRRRMIDEIRRLPAGTAEYQTTHDPIPGVVPDGITVKIRLTVDPDEGLVTCDFTENEDSQQCGLNLCEATVTAAARCGVVNRLGVSDLPLCEGAFSRIIVKIREGSVVGKAKHPFSSSAATSNVNDRTFAATMCAFNQITDHLAMAESHFEHSVGLSVISGKDSRYGGRPYITQLIMAYSGGMAVNGHDGYLHQQYSAGGMWVSNPVEMTESAYPILFLEQEVETDAIGFGQWDGAPAIRVAMAPTHDPVTFWYGADGHHNPGRGAAGGHSGTPAQAWLCVVRNGVDLAFSGTLPLFPDPMTLEPGEALCGIYCSGGGYGDPLERDPELVRHRVREGWLSLGKAKEVYGVVVDTGSELYAVDSEATAELRRKLRDKR